MCRRSLRADGVARRAAGRVSGQGCVLLANSAVTEGCLFGRFCRHICLCGLICSCGHPTLFGLSLCLFECCLRACVCVRLCLCEFMRAYVWLQLGSLFSRGCHMVPRLFRSSDMNTASRPSEFLWSNNNKEMRSEGSEAKITPPKENERRRIRRKMLMAET